MKYYKFIKNFFIVFFIMMILIEINYQLQKVEFRNKVDFKVKKLIPSFKEKNFRIVVLGDSLSAGAFSKIKIKEEILDLTSVSAITLVGNYYMLNRYLKNNQSPEEVYLFFIPQMLDLDLNNEYTYTYVKSVFQNNDEVEEMSKFNSINKKFLFFDRYFESRYKYIEKFNKIKNYQSPVRKKYERLDYGLLKNDLNESTEVMQKNFLKYSRTYNTMKDVPKYYLKKMIDLCLEKNIKLNIIIEPTSVKINELFKKSNWFNYIKTQDIRFININDYYKFSEKSFFDGTHLNEQMNNFYQNLLNQKVLNFIE